MKFVQSVTCLFCLSLSKYLFILQGNAFAKQRSIFTKKVINVIVYYPLLLMEFMHCRIPSQLYICPSMTERIMCVQA